MNQGQRIIAKKVEWQNTLKHLKRTESLCKTWKEMIDSESKFQKDNGSILAWITTTNPKRDHDLLCKRLGVTGIYGDCGKWLFEDSVYRGWRGARNASKSVLWLRGTGKQY